MASVTDDTLTTEAKRIVNEYNSGSGNLTDLTKTAVASLSYNKDQASRLVEKVNTEAFLHKFSKHETDFEVANPKEVLDTIGGDLLAKTASETHRGKTEGSVFKVASVQDLTYRQARDMTPEEIFGITENTKTASYDDHGLGHDKKRQLIAENYAEKIASELAIIKLSHDMQVERVKERLFSAYKTAALIGDGTDVEEEKLLLLYKTKTARVFEVVNEMNDRLASKGDLPYGTIKRAAAKDFNVFKIVAHDDVTRAFGELMELES